MVFLIRSSICFLFFFFSSRRRHTRCSRDWSSDVCSSDLFKGTGNMEVILDRRIADRRVYPAIEVQRTSTRKEELLLTKEELNKVYLLRNFLSDMPPVEAIEFLLERMKRTKTRSEEHTSELQSRLH